VKVTIANEFRWTTVAIGRLNLLRIDALLSHGMRFEVAMQYDQIEQALSQMDPAALKAASPWPKQTPEAVEEMAAMTGAELQARGWGAPPYHPCCRGYLILPDDTNGPAG
jgi:hypothetical protein